MTSMSFLLIVLSVFLSVVAQIFLKHGMSHPNIHTSFESGISPGLFAILTNISVLAGLLAYVSSAAVWLGVLAKVEVSKAYPFVGLGFIGTMLFGYFFLHEPLTTTKIIGTLLILVGVLFVSR